jgi:nicotinamide-nucleotide amidase
MTQDRNAEIIAIGTEILLGEITDTNSVFIARTLRDIGINLYFTTSVGDNEKRIESAIRIALSRAQIVITCGGLGPTIDDMTRQAVAAATDRALTFHQELLDIIAQRFAGFRVQMTENNRRQAYLPDSAIVIENPVGTAPGFIVEQGDSVVISLPGVPREMKYLMIEKVVPYVREKFSLGGKIIKARVLKTAGIGESALDELIGKDALEAANPTVGLAAHSGQVDVRITAKADSEEEADRMIALAETDLRERIEQYIFAIDTGTIEQALSRILIERDAAIAISETGIDSVISARLAAVAVGQDFLRAVFTFPDPASLANSLGVNTSTPLRELAELEAARICGEGQRAEVGIALVCRPDEAQDRDDMQEGSAIAVWVANRIRSRSYGFGGGTEMAHFWTGTWGMSMAWRMLREVDG